MEDQLTIQLSAQCIALFSSDRESFVSALHKELMKQVDEIEEYLPRYCIDMREDFTDGSTVIEDNIKVENDGSGSINISFDGYVHMGCKDLCRSVEHEDSFSFTIDFENATLELEFPFPSTRDPDEF